MKVKRRRIQKNGQALHRFLVAMIFGLILFMVIRPSFVDVIAKESDLSLFLVTDDVKVDTKVGANGFRQIKYNYNGNDIEVTESNVTNSDPDTDGEYIVWMAQIDNFWQIMLYYIPGDQTIQISSGENNVNPAISGKNVVWEGQVNGIWQIFLFDGIKTIQLTNTLGPSQNADIEGDYIVYGDKDLENEKWKIYLYNILTEETKSLTFDSNGRFPTISDGIVEWVSVGIGDTEDYFYEISTDTLGTHRPETTEVPLVSEFDETAFEEFVSDLDEGVTETPQTTSSEQQIDSEDSLEPSIGDLQPEEVTVNDIEDELGITN